MPGLPRAGRADSSSGRGLGKQSQPSAAELGCVAPSSPAATPRASRPFAALASSGEKPQGEAEVWAPSAGLPRRDTLTLGRAKAHRQYPRGALDPVPARVG